MRSNSKEFFARGISHDLVPLLGIFHGADLGIKVFELSD
jgi:hypothetical protein